MLAPVHPHFQLVVCIKAADLPSTPLPFLNRFEKFYCSPADLAVRTASQLCGGQISRDVLKNFLVGAAGVRLHDLVQLLGPASLVGYQPATLGSAINEALPGAAEALEALAAAWHGREEQRAALEMRPLPPRLAEALASHRRKPKAGVHPRNMQPWSEKPVGFPSQGFNTLCSSCPYVLRLRVGSGCLHPCRQQRSAWA